MATHETPNPNPNRMLSSLPEDIMYNIFLCLPVKNLLISKSVCKSWLSIISSRDFIQTHLSISTNDPHFTRHRLILADLWTCSLYSLTRETFTYNTSLYRDLRIDRIVGYCNGLVVVRDWFRANQLILWNPSTRELRELPKLDWICFVPITMYGFCYDESNDDFKVFDISPALPNYNQSDESRTHYKYKVFVYSIKCDSWRMIGDFPFRLACDWSTYYTLRFDDGNFANRSIYWSVSPQLQKKIIVSLDIETEMWQEVPRPNFGDGVFQWTLGTFGKSLSVLCQFENTRADLWIMKGCGVEMSWTKLFTILYMDPLIKCDSYLKPICISTDGDIVLNLDETMILYNLKDHTFKDLCANQDFTELKVYPYVESLVSPHL